MKSRIQSHGHSLDVKITVYKGHIQVDAAGDGYVATDFVVLFDKQVRVSLGKQFRTSIKEIKVLNYEIETELEEAPKKKITVPFAKSVKFSGKVLRLTYDKISFSNIKDQYVEKTIKLIKEKITLQNYEGKDEFRECLWKGKERPVVYRGDPAEDLEKLGWIKRTDTKGQFIYGRRFTALVSVIKKLYVENVYRKIGFFEMGFPKFEPWSVPMKSGHAKNIYPSAYFVSVPKSSSAEDWQDVMDLFEITGDIPEEKVREKSVCVGIMSFAQCPPFWPMLRGKVIDEANLPLLVYDWSGPTYRNEAGGTHGLDRLEEFNRVETLFVGTKEQVVKTWKRLKEEYTKFYDEILDMEIKVSSVTPWWMAHAGVRTASDDADIGTFDFDAYLPYRGDRTKDWLEIQNDSSNGEKYPRAFNVRAKNREYLWSGCAGAAFQRIIVAFLAQKGLDPKNWPPVIRERFEEKTKGIKGLKFY